MKQNKSIMFLHFNFLNLGHFDIDKFSNIDDLTFSQLCVAWIKLFWAKLEKLWLNFEKILFQLFNKINLKFLISYESQVNW